MKVGIYHLQIPDFLRSLHVAFSLHSVSSSITRLSLFFYEFYLLLTSKSIMGGGRLHKLGTHCKYSLCIIVVITTHRNTSSGGQGARQPVPHVPPQLPEELSLSASQEGIVMCVLQMRNWSLKEVGQVF